jgi:hypothetical protein
MKRRIGKTGRRSCQLYPDKVRYKDHSSAVFVAASIRKNHPSRPELPARAYECPGCGGWHLTSQEENRD